MEKSNWTGCAASVIMPPVVRDFERYPRYGRDLSLCVLDVGLNGAWTKRGISLEIPSEALFAPATVALFHGNLKMYLIARGSIGPGRR